MTEIKSKKSVLNFFRRIMPGVRLTGAFVFLFTGVEHHKISAWFSGLLKGTAVDNDIIQVLSTIYKILPVVAFSLSVILLCSVIKNRRITHRINQRL